jgi:endonuclease YncB( thermonuclease family)
MSWVAAIPIWAGVAILGIANGAGWLDGWWKTDPAEAATAPVRAATKFGFCHTGGGINCVVDGDTIWLDGSKIRIADIDAPETHDYGCASEKDLGDQATRRLHDLLESGPISLRSIDRDQDRYGRKLRIVIVNGRSVGDILVAEGLARWYGHGRRPWC